MSADDLKRLEQAGHAPAVRLLRGDGVKLEPVRWLWRNFLPAGMVTLLGGAPGCGKTTIALSLAAVLTTAGRWPDGTRCADTGDVIVWSGEDGPSVLAARLAASGADMTRVHFVDGLTGCENEGFDPGRDMALLEATAEKLPCVRLLILDPIVSAVSGDGNKSNEVRRALQPVVELAQRLNCAVLGITHLTKGTMGREPTERITGSLAFAALARMVLIAAKHKSDDGEDERRVLLRAKSNIGPDDGGIAYALERIEVAPEIESQRVQWREAIEGTAREILGEAEASGDADSASEVESFVLECLQPGPIPANTFRRDAEGAGLIWRTVQRTAKKLGASSRKQGMTGGWQWGFFDPPPKATKQPPEGDEGDTQKTVTPSPSSAAPVTPSGDVEVY